MDERLNNQPGAQAEPRPAGQAAGLWQKYRPLFAQFLRFGVVGVVNTGIDFAVFNALIWLTGITTGGGIIPIKGAAFLTANVNSYVLNKRWTFKDNTTGETARKFSIYLSVSVVGALINISAVYLITTFMPPQFGLSATLWANLANLVATGLSLVWNFVGYKLVVFRGK